MNLIKPDVQTLCMGFAASFGALLLLSGAKGKRFALPNSEIMIHQPLGGAQGQATEIEITAKRILKLKHDINKMIAEKTGQPIERVAHDTERDYFMTAEEAKEYGIVDDVVTKNKMKKARGYINSLAFINPLPIHQLMLDFLIHFRAASSGSFVLFNMTINVPSCSSFIFHLSKYFMISG